MIEREDLYNTNYKSDIEYTVQIHRLLLRMLGVWPVREGFCHSKKLLQRFRNSVCFFLLAFSLIPLALYMFVIVNTLKIRLRMFSALCLYSMVSIMYCTLIYQERNIAECIRHVAQDWRNVSNECDRKIMLDKARTGRAIFIGTTFLLYTSGFSYRLIQAINKSNIVVGNVTIRPLVKGNYYIFFDPQESPAYEIVFSIQCVAGIVIHSVTSSVCGVTILFAMHACGQLEILTGWLRKITSQDRTRKKDAVIPNLAKIVAHHVRIRKFLHQTQNIIGEMCFVGITGSTLILCLLGYYIVTGWEQSDSISLLTYTIILVSYTCHIFILCYVGEALNTQGNKLNITCCSIDWYCLSNKEIRCFPLVIIMASYSTKIRASKFIDLSFSSFGAVVRTALAYLNLLRTVTI